MIDALPGMTDATQRRITESIAATDRASFTFSGLTDVLGLMR